VARSRAADRRTMRQRVIADHMPGIAGLLHKRARLGIA
jgi:hypothetical protein